MIFHFKTNVNKRTMKKIQYQCPHLGAYIAQLQHTVPVEGLLLSESALARSGHMSKSTVERIKKG